MHSEDPVLRAIFGDGTQAVRVVEHVFAVLGATYGAAWDRSLGQAPLSDTKTVWAARLSDWLGNDNAKRAVLWALKNLPEQVPNAVQFAALCRQAPHTPQPLLPAPPANPERMRQALARLSASAAPRHDRLAWARKILTTPQGRTPTVLQMARDALGRHDAAHATPQHHAGGAACL